jgi:hypothetical protein
VSTVTGTVDTRPIVEFFVVIAVQLGKKNGGFSAAFCKTVKNKGQPKSLSVSLF